MQNVKCKVGNEEGYGDYTEMRKEIFDKKGLDEILVDNVFYLYAISYVLLFVSALRCNFFLQ